ncbi:MAG: hypothetical protein LBO69_01360 [Ignavibacteria bacterium]|nr:hypothetical protein [Ignavibacteria bacterium]
MPPIRIASFVIMDPAFIQFAKLKPLDVPVSKSPTNPPTDKIRELVIISQKFIQFSIDISPAKTFPPNLPQNAPMLIEYNGSKISTEIYPSNTKFLILP